MSSAIHSANVGRDCRKRAAQKWGLGWSMLSDEQKQGAIALEVVSVMFAVSSSAVDYKDKTVASLDHLRAVGQAALYPEEK